jgi:hypothetical protein
MSRPNPKFTVLDAALGGVIAIAGSVVIAGMWIADAFRTLFGRSAR